MSTSSLSKSRIERAEESSFARVDDPCGTTPGISSSARTDTNENYSPSRWSRGDADGPQGLRLGSRSPRNDARANHQSPHQHNVTASIGSTLRPPPSDNSGTYYECKYDP
jgi:hypothetical protein